MSTSRISIIVVAFVLVIASTFTVQFLFARGETWGDICVSGETVDTSTITVNPPKESNPPSYVETTKSKIEKTDSLCEEMTCIPQDCECNSWETFPRVTEIEYSIEYIRQSTGGYREGDFVPAPMKQSGTYYRCADSMGNSSY